MRRSVKMTNSLYQRYATDPGAEKEGQLLRLGDVRMLVARAGGSNEAFKRVFSQKTKPYRYELQKGTMDDDVSTDIMVETYAETIVLGWEQKIDGEWQPYILGPDDEKLEFTKENFCKVMKDLPELFKEVVQFANATEAFLAQEEEDDMGNSLTSSSGTSSGGESSNS